jgi:hypothetical protein
MMNWAEVRPLRCCHIRKDRAGKPNSYRISDSPSRAWLDGKPLLLPTRASASHVRKGKRGGAEPSEDGSHGLHLVVQLFPQAPHQLRQYFLVCRCAALPDLARFGCFILLSRIAILLQGRSPYPL